MIPVVTFYLLRDWDHLVARARELIPRKYEVVVTHLTKNCDAVLAEFFRGQLLVMLAQGVFYSLGLWVIGLEFSLLIGLSAGLVSFVPYLGFIVGIVIAGVAALMQFHDVLHIIYVLIVFGAGQMLEGMVLTPAINWRPHWSASSRSDICSYGRGTIIWSFRDAHCFTCCRNSYRLVEVFSRAVFE